MYIRSGSAEDFEEKQQLLAEISDLEKEKEKFCKRTDADKAKALKIREAAMGSMTVSRSPAPEEEAGPSSKGNYF